MTKMMKRFGVAGLLGGLAMTVSPGYCGGGMEELRAGTAGFETGMDIKEIIGAQRLETAVPQPAAADVKASADPDLPLVSATRELIPAVGRVQTSYMSYIKEVLHEAHGFPHNGLAERERKYNKAYEDYRSLLMAIVNQTVKHKTPAAREMCDIEIEMPDLVKNVIMATGAYCSAVSEASLFDNLSNRNKMYDREIEMKEKQDKLGKKLGRLAALAQHVQD